MLRRTIVGAILAAALASSAAAQAPPVVFAAASLKEALDAAAAAWRTETGRTVRLSYAASSALARQLDAGAPADLFVSADVDWMDWAQQRSLVKSASRVELLGNRLALIAPRDSAANLTLASGAPLAAMLGSGRLAIGLVEAVPAGKYGKAALEALGLWDSVKHRTAQAENVRAALLLVSRKEAPLGVVYRTDAAADPNVRIVDLFPESSHPRIVYPMALTAKSDNADAAAFARFLRGPAAAAIFERQGFAVLSRGP